jgi:hypothetical protein
MRQRHHQIVDWWAEVKPSMDIALIMAAIKPPRSTRCQVDRAKQLIDWLGRTVFEIPTLPHTLVALANGRASDGFK